MGVYTNIVNFKIKFVSPMFFFLIIIYLHFKPDNRENNTVCELSLLLDQL